MKITKTTEHEPWEIYLDTLPTEEIEARSELQMLKSYHLFLEGYGKGENICLVCGRKFKPRKKKEE